MDFFKEHTGIRVIIMLVSFIVSLVLVLTGWKMAGEMAGLLRMILGVGFLLVTLKVYNIPFEDKKTK